MERGCNFPASTMDCIRHSDLIMNFEKREKRKKNSHKVTYLNLNRMII